MRELILDDAIPPGLAAELAARGRPARTVAELGLAGATDAEVLEAAAGAVLVTTTELRGAGAVAVVEAPTPAGRRELVHRLAHVMAAQRAGSVRRYRR